MVGVGALAGIGFTVSVFIAGLAFRDPQLVSQAKVGILLASVAASLLGAALLWPGRATGLERSPPRLAGV